MTADPVDPPFWRSVCWPIIICVLLGGHMTIMMIAMTFALAAPPELVPSSYTDATLGRPTTVELPNESTDPPAAQR